MKKLKDVLEFDEIIKNKVLIDFYADWCGPCKMMKEVLKSIEDEIDYDILEVNVDKFRRLSAKYGVMSIPSLKIFNNGEIEKEKTGFMTEAELREFLDL